MVVAMIDIYRHTCRILCLLLPAIPTCPAAIPLMFFTCYLLLISTPSTPNLCQLIKHFCYYMPSVSFKPLPDPLLITSHLLPSFSDQSIPLLFCFGFSDLWTTTQSLPTGPRVKDLPWDLFFDFFFSIYDSRYPTRATIKCFAPWHVPKNWQPLTCVLSLDRSIEGFQISTSCLIIINLVKNSLCLTELLIHTSGLISIHLSTF